ncbi:MAG: SDR family NAD(P)-dependent oxidoreductase [Anaerolineae bacterium]
MESKRFAGQTVIVTGGGSGIGRATVRKFAQEGAKIVVIVDQYQDRVDSIATEIEQLGTQAIRMCLNLGSIEAGESVIHAALQASHRIDVVVSNAAAWTVEPFLELKDESWERILAVNLTTAFVLGQRAAREMAKAQRGVILYTASISALGANRGFSPYNVTKAGIVALVKSMAVELAPFNIRVNAVSPGGVDSQMSVDHLGEERMSRLRKSFPAAPLNRLASPEDVASAFAFLASDEASYITGTNLMVDGGLTAQVYEPPN